jgi:hypothetical protein
VSGADRAAPAGKHILACVFGPPIREYQRDLVGEIARRFALTWTER